jgi:hypothetical protein
MIILAVAAASGEIGYYQAPAHPLHLRMELGLLHTTTVELLLLFMHAADDVLNNVRNSPKLKKSTRAYYYNELVLL